MNTDLTEIAFLLDRSGSMQSMVEPAIAGFNQFLREQQDAEGSARLTLVLFDDDYLVPCDQLPIAEVTRLDTTTYVPRGCTALLDAIGRTIDELGQKLAALPKKERPGQVIVAIFTDGLENASTDYTLERVNKMIPHQREAYQWQFLFLGANQDAIATAARMGIDHHNSAQIQYSEAGIRSSSTSMSRKMSALRRQARTGESTDDLTAPLSEIADEEHRKAEDEERGN